MNTKIIKGVYCLTSPSGKKYVGIGCGKKGIKGRWEHYRCLACKNQPKIYNALKKYGPENFKYEILLETDDVANAKRSEMYVIDVWNLQDDRFGYNISAGGDCSQLGLKPSTERIEKIRIANIGRVQSQEEKDKRSKSLKEFWLSDVSLEAKNKISLFHKGKKYNKETCNKISNSKLGYKQSEEHKKNILKKLMGNTRRKGTCTSIEGRKNMSLAARAYDYYFNGIKIENMVTFTKENNIPKNCLYNAFRFKKSDKIKYKNNIVERIKI